MKKGIMMLILIVVVTSFITPGMAKSGYNVSCEKIGKTLMDSFSLVAS